MLLNDRYILREWPGESRRLSGPRQHDTGERKLLGGLGTDQEQTRYPARRERRTNEVGASERVALREGAVGGSKRRKRRGQRGLSAAALLHRQMKLGWNPWLSRPRHLPTL